MPEPFPRFDVVPDAGHQAVFTLDGKERARWHFGSQYPRPFLYPLTGSSGVSLTRMGHPGAPNHDHHQSVWFAHHDVGGVDFWGNHSEARIRQKRWLAYQYDRVSASMAVELAWEAGHDFAEVLTQELIISMFPWNKGVDWVFESVFRPLAREVTFGKTNFGFLAVRVARHLSEHFGAGVLTSSAGQVHEKAIFGKPAKWVDYSGPVKGGGHEGITYFDHPSNPGYPNRWHVREDGWMGCSPCMNGPLVATREKPLRLRVMLTVHEGKVDARAADRRVNDFAGMKPASVRKAGVKHQEFLIERK